MIWGGSKIRKCFIFLSECIKWFQMANYYTLGGTHGGGKVIKNQCNKLVSISSTWYIQCVFRIWLVLTSIPFINLRHLKWKRWNEFSKILQKSLCLSFLTYKMEQLQQLLYWVIIELSEFVYLALTSESTGYFSTKGHSVGAGIPFSQCPSLFLLHCPSSEHKEWKPNSSWGHLETSNILTGS